jgi:hypothetical protein
MSYNIDATGTLTFVNVAQAGFRPLSITTTRTIE